MRDGPRGFKRDFTCPALLRILIGLLWISLTGLSPSLARFPKRFCYPLKCHDSVLQPRQINLPVWALSCSLAATWEIDISFSSCIYLDVSVHCVFLPYAMYSLKDSMSAHAGFPHSETSGSKPTYGSPKTFAVSRVLHRLPVPRHSPCALLHLTLQVCSFELSRSLCNVFIDLNDSRFFLGIKIFSFQRTNLAFRPMEANGIEPMTSCLQSRCSPS